MAKKSEGYIQLEKMVEGLEEKLAWVQAENTREIKEAVEQATLPYKENLLQYTQLMRVISAATEDTLPAYIYQEMLRLMNETSILLNKTEE